MALITAHSPPTGMRWREYPVLPEDDPRLEEFQLSLGSDAARVLAYLVGRRESSKITADEAPRLTIRVGTGLGRDATIAALSRLEDAGLVTATTVSRDAAGRPPKGWVVTAGPETLAWRLRRDHGRRLLERARAVAAHFGTPLPEDWLGGVELPEAGVEGRDHLAVTLNWVPNGLHAPLIAAADFGIYDAHGLDVEFESARGSGAAVDRLTDGAADVAIVGAASFCRAERQALVPLALLHQRSMAVLYTTTSRLGEPFTSVEQLRGCRLAVTPDSEVGRLARLFLAQAGVLEDVEIVPTAGEERDALERGDADVATGMPSDPRELEDAGRDVSSLSVADHFPVPGPALVTSQDVAMDAPGTVARFLMGTLGGAVAARGDPDRVATSVAAWSDDDVESERWRLDHALDSADGGLVREHGWGWQTVEAWERLQAALRQEAGG